MAFNFFTASKKPDTSTKISQLLWRDNDVIVSRKRMKSIRLKLTHSGELKLSCPHFVTDTELLSFLNARRHWIANQQHKLAERQLTHTQSVKPGVIQLWGEQHPVSSLLQQSTESMTQVQLDKAQQEILRVEMKNYLAEHLPAWQERMGVQANFWNVKTMKTKWGSCNVHKKRIWLNLQLARYPAICAQMVLVHELVHLQEASHNKRFYQLMDNYLPDWRSADEILKNAHL